MNEIYFPRQMEQVVLEAAEYFSVIAITGARQTGKSTLLKQLFPAYKMYSMKDLNVLQFAQQDPIAFLNQHKDGMFIDEVQKAPQLLDYIQGIVDGDASRKFVLSGSSHFELMSSLSESLAGRCAIFDLMPMSFTEFDSSQMTTDQLLWNGLYPAICAQKNKAHLYYPSYVKTYLEKDVRDLLRVKDQMQFLKFLKLCAGRIGSLVNASELANEIGVDSKTIAHWFSVLQASYIITLLPPYYENISKRIVKSPKLYFNDTGLACYLLDIESPTQLEHDKMRGELFENMIVMECLKHRFNQGKASNVYFYRDSNQNEVDILLKQNGELTAIEVKSAMTYNSSFEKRLRKLPEWTTTPISQRAVVYTGDFENTMGEIQLLNYRHLPSLLLG